MTLQIPYGRTKFELDDGGGNTYTPAVGQIYLEDEDDIVETDIHETPASTGKRHGILRKNHRQWIFKVIGITEAQWLTLEALRDAEVELTPHADEPTITYDCHLTTLIYGYDKGRYYRDSATLTLTERSVL